MSYDDLEIAVLKNEATRDYVPFDSDAWRQMIAQAEREDQEEFSQK